MSKSSQKDAKKAKKTAEPKASKNGRTPKEKIPYEFKPLAKSFTGVAGKATMAGRLLTNVPFHSVTDGKTACGYDVTQPSPGLSTYELNWQAVTDKVTCARCIKALAKPEKPAKEPTPITKAKGKKAAAAK